MQHNKAFLQLTEQQATFGDLDPISETDLKMAKLNFISYKLLFLYMGQGKEPMYLSNMPSNHSKI